MEFPTCIVTAVLMPGCWVKDLFSLLLSNIGDDSYFLLMLGPCPAGNEVYRKTHLLFATAELAGFSQCVILSEKDGGRGWVRRWISSCCYCLRASCFLFCNLYINTSSYLLYKSAGCSRQHQGAHDGVWMYVCLCQNRVVTQADLLLLQLRWLKCCLVYLKDMKARGSLIFW